jgi:Flp pilus assembly protein TadD
MIPWERTPGLDELEFRALIPLWEEARRADPDDLMTLSWLGTAYTRVGRVEDGLEIDRALVRLLPDDAIARYNLACSLALLGRPDDAFAALEDAVRLGYRDVDHLREDEDVDSLRGDPRFREIVRRLDTEAASSPPDC